MKADRVVCDTNVLISAAIIPHGKPRAVLEHVKLNGQLLMSSDALVELKTRLARPKFDRYLSAEAREQFFNALASVVELVVTTGTLRVCRDPDDDKIIETAIVGRADALVTGDKDLLALRPVGAEAEASTVDAAAYGGTAILTPAEFLKLRGV